MHLSLHRLVELWGWFLSRPYHPRLCMSGMEEGDRQQHSLPLVHLEAPLPTPSKETHPSPFFSQRKKPLWMLTWRQIPKKSQPTSSTNSQTRISVWAQLEHSIFLEPIGSTHCLPWLRAQLMFTLIPSCAFSHFVFTPTLRA